MGVKDPEQRLESWVSSVQIHAAELEEKLIQTEIYEAALQERLDKQMEDAAEMSASLSKLRAEKDQMRQARERIITEGAKQSVIAIPERVQQAMITMASEADFYELVNFFESAKRVNLQQFPVGGSQKAVSLIPKMSEPEYGSADAGIDFSEKTFI